MTVVTSGEKAGHVRRPSDLGHFHSRTTLRTGRTEKVKMQLLPSNARAQSEVRAQDEAWSGLRGDEDLVSFWGNDRAPLDLDSTAQPALGSLGRPCFS